VDDALRRSIEALEAALGDPRRGLPKEMLPLLVSESIRGGDTRGHHISLLFRCRLLSPPDAARRAATDPPPSGQWRWHDRCPPDLLEVQRPYMRFF
jgi:hypothetical protein